MAKRGKRPKQGVHPSRHLRSTVNTGLLHVYRGDWLRVTAGVKPEYRTWGHSKLGDQERPILLYTVVESTGEVLSQLAVLETSWKERLGEITPAGLADEGFADLDAFRTYWRGRYPKGGWRPLCTIQVHRIRLWTPADVEKQGRYLLRRLYGDRDEL